MFSKIIDFKHCCNEEQRVEYLYDIFRKDFINDKTYLNDVIYIDPKIYDRENGKEKIFWHIITRKDKKNKVREFDPFRACRIKWIKPMILNYLDEKIKFFYYYEYNKKIRLYLWAFEYDFAVILQKLGNKNSYLVTSFYIDNQRKRSVFQKKFKDYNEKTDPRLNNCEWF